MRLTTLLRDADPVPEADTTLTMRARAELRALVGPEPVDEDAAPARRHRPVPKLAAGLVGVASIAAAAVVLVSSLQTASVPATPAAPTPSAPLVSLEPAPAGMPSSLREVQECMAAAGEVAHYTGMGGLEGDEVPAGQTSNWTAVLLECWEKTGYTDPLTTDDLRVLYALEVANHQCLVDAGFPSDEPPSEATYLEQWATSNAQNRLKPYDSVDAVFRTDDFRAAMALCPSPRWNYGGGYAGR